MIKNIIITIQCILFILLMLFNTVLLREVSTLQGDCQRCLAEKNRLKGENNIYKTLDDRRAWEDRQKQVANK